MMTDNTVPRFLCASVSPSLPEVPPLPLRCLAVPQAEALILRLVQEAEGGALIGELLGHLWPEIPTYEAYGRVYFDDERPGALDRFWWLSRRLHALQAAGLVSIYDFDESCDMGRLIQLPKPEAKAWLIERCRQRRAKMQRRKQRRSTHRLRVRGHLGGAVGHA